MNAPFNVEQQKWQFISQEAEFIASHYPAYGQYNVRRPEEVLETALIIGLDVMRDEIVQHQTLEWLIREKRE